MFGKNQKVPLQAVETPVLAWDEETVEHFAKSNQFNVKITSISKRQGFGMTSRDGPMRESNGHEINGVITYPKYILVTIALEKDLGEFGVWSYKLYNTSNGSEKVNVPLLEFVVADPSGDIAEALHEGQMAALAAGRRYSAVRFWKHEVMERWRRGIESAVVRTKVDIRFSECIRGPNWKRPTCRTGQCRSGTNSSHSRTYQNRAISAVVCRLRRHPLGTIGGFSSG